MGTSQSKMKLIVASTLAVLALANSSLAVPATSQNVGTCHSEDYIACALVTAGCAAGDCNGKDNWLTCMTNCVINKHQKQCIDCIPKKVTTVKKPQNVGTCHSEDYIACALVTAG